MLLLGLIGLIAPPNACAQEQEQPIGEAPEERDAEDIFLRDQRLLLCGRHCVVDVGQFFSRSDDLQLAVAGNAVQLATREQTLLATVLAARLGIGRETEIFAATAFYRQTDRVFAGEADLATASRNEIGDVGVGIRHTFLREAAGRPDIIGTFDAVIPTSDTTPYAIGGGVVLVKSIDPVVLFAGTAYHRSLRRTRDDGTQLPSADGATVSLGYGLALNDTLAISTAASGTFMSTRRLASLLPRRSETFSLRFALTSALARGLYIEPSVSMGLSGPGRSFTMGVTVPYAF